VIPFNILLLGFLFGTEKSLKSFLEKAIFTLSLESWPCEEMEENGPEDDAANDMDRVIWIWCKDSGSGDGSFECGGIHEFRNGVDELLRSIFLALDFSQFLQMWRLGM
jgi:hypothetical protein